MILMFGATLNSLKLSPLAVMVLKGLGMILFNRKDNPIQGSLVMARLVMGMDFVPLSFITLTVIGEVELVMAPLIQLNNKLSVVLG